MAIIEEYTRNGCTVRVHDDCIRPPEEVKQIIKRVSQIVYSEEMRRHMEEKNQNRYTDNNLHQG